MSSTEDKRRLYFATTAHRMEVKAVGQMSGVGCWLTVRPSLTIPQKRPVSKRPNFGCCTVVRKNPKRGHPEAGVKLLQVTALNTSRNRSTTIDDTVHRHTTGMFDVKSGCQFGGFGVTVLERSDQLFMLCIGIAAFGFATPWPEQAKMH